MANKVKKPKPTYYLVNMSDCNMFEFDTDDFEWEMEDYIDCIDDPDFVLLKRVGVETTIVKLKVTKKVVEDIEEPDDEE